MKLWLLEAIEGADDWDPWYDKMFGIVVRSETEESARIIAHGAAEDENRKWLVSKAEYSKAPWIDQSKSTCVELTAQGYEAVILRDISQS